MKGSTQRVSSEGARQTALQLLSRREYSQRELHQKLAAKFPAELLDAVLAELAEQGLQSDSRYAEVWIRSRINQGYGPVRIQVELRQKGITAEVVQELVEGEGIDWFEQASSLFQRRFGHHRPADAKQKAKQMRFLQYRGFTHEQIRHVFASTD